MSHKKVKEREYKYFQLIIPGGEFLPDWVDEVRAKSKNDAAHIFRKVLMEREVKWFPLRKLYKFIKVN